MIIKGGSRGGPANLARHLLRADTNETVSILETTSCLSDDTKALHESLRDMQMLVAGTKGEKGLYHANIDPEAKYTMHDEDWLKCVEILEKELGLENQPRAIVKHEKKGRAHLHVVWQRTDPETWTLRSDSWNYPAHENASRALEKLLDHDLVPGAFTAKEPDQQRPIAEMNHAEWQKFERSGLHPKDRRELVRQLYEQSDNGAAFKAALEEHGYLLAKGDRSPVVIVDPAGEVHALRSEFKGIYKAKEVYSKIEDVRDTLPEAGEAILKQLQRQEAAPQADVKPLPGQGGEGEVPTPMPGTEKPEIEIEIATDQNATGGLTFETEPAAPSAYEQEKERIENERRRMADDHHRQYYARQLEWMREEREQLAKLEKLHQQRRAAADPADMRYRAKQDQQIMEFWDALQKRYNPNAKTTERPAFDPEKLPLTTRENLEKTHLLERIHRERDQHLRHLAYDHRREERFFDINAEEALARYPEHRQRKPAIREEQPPETPDIQEQQKDADTLLQEIQARARKRKEEEAEREARRRNKDKDLDRDDDLER